MKPSGSRLMLLLIAIAVASGLITFAVVRSASTQEPRNRDVGLSDEQRNATYTAGSAASVAEYAARNQDIVAQNPSLSDMQRSYGGGELFGLGYRTVADLAGNPLTNLIARGVVTAQRLALGDAAATHLVVISTLNAPSELKGDLGASVEVSTPVSVTSDTKAFRLGVSDAYALPDVGDDVIMFLQSVTGGGIPVVLPWGTYVVRSDDTMGLPEGGYDQLDVSGKSTLQFLADVNTGIQQASQE